MSNEAKTVKDTYQVIESVQPTPENLRQLTESIFKHLPVNKQAGTVEELDAERNRLINQVSSAPNGSADAEMALAGLRQFGQVVYDSGVPQALLAFGITYKLVSGLTAIDQQADRDYSILSKKKASLFRSDIPVGSYINFLQDADLIQALGAEDDSTMHVIAGTLAFVCNCYTRRSTGEVLSLVLHFDAAGEKKYLVHVNDIGKVWHIIEKSNDSQEGWYGIDFDGTLCYYDADSSDEFGEPVGPILELVKGFLTTGTKFKIMTARAADPEQAKLVKDWCRKQGLGDVEVTDRKDFKMIALFDDRAIRVERNKGTFEGEY